MDERKDIHTKKRRRKKNYAKIHQGKGKGHRRKKIEVAVGRKARSCTLELQSYKTDTQCFQSKNYRCPARVPIDVTCNCNKIFPDEKLTNKICKMDVHPRQALGQRLVAKKFITKGSFICQYKGKFVNSKTKGMYVAKLTSKTSIDAESFECLGKYVNHSCAPNATLENIIILADSEFKTRGRGKRNPIKDDGENNELWILAKTDIKKGEEITFSYGDDSKDFFVYRKCLCDLCRTV